MRLLPSSQPQPSSHPLLPSSRSSRRSRPAPSPPRHTRLRRWLSPSPRARSPSTRRGRLRRSHPRARRASRDSSLASLGSPRPPPRPSPRPPLRSSLASRAPLPRHSMRSRSAQPSWRPRPSCRTRPRRSPRLKQDFRRRCRCASDGPPLRAASRLGPARCVIAAGGLSTPAAPARPAATPSDSSPRPSRRAHPQRLRDRRSVQLSEALPYRHPPVGRQRPSSPCKRANEAAQERRARLHWSKPTPIAKSADGLHSGASRAARATRPKTLL